MKLKIAIDKIPNSKVEAKSKIVTRFLSLKNGEAMKVLDVDRRKMLAIYNRIRQHIMYHNIKVNICRKYDAKNKTLFVWKE